QRFGGAVIDVSGFIFLAQLNVEIRQFGLGGGVLGIKFQYLLKQAGCLVVITRLEELVRHLHVVAAGIVEKALLGIEFGQLDDCVRRHRGQLGQLLVDGNGFYSEAVLGVLVAYPLEVFAGSFVLAHPGIEVSNGIEDRQVLGVLFNDFFVFDN